MWAGSIGRRLVFSLVCLLQSIGGDGAVPTMPPYQKSDHPARLSRSIRGYTRQWYKIRKIKLGRNPECEAREPGCRLIATEVDHIDNNQGHNKWCNLMALCKVCHSRKTVRCDGGLAR